MNNLPIRMRLLLLALAPLTIIVLLLALHSTVNRIHDLDNALRDHGQAIARQLAPACEYGVFAGNRVILNRLASPRWEKDVARAGQRCQWRVLAQAENAALADNDRRSALVFGADRPQRGGHRRLAGGWSRRIWHPRARRPAARLG